VSRPIRHPSNRRGIAVTLMSAALLLLQGCSRGSEGNPAVLAAPATPAMREKGRYLALAANCAACHTTAEGAPLAGGVAFDTPFGKVYSANITPDAATGIGSWSVSQFAASLRKGVSANGRHLYPVFPYPAFTNITDEDAAALFAHLKSVPAVRFEVPANEMSFPFGQRWLLAPWNALFLDTGPFKPDPARSAEVNRGAYLVKGLAHCSACHSPRNVLGAERDGQLMTGGVYRDESADGVVRPWSAPNLTPVPNGLGAWPAEQIVAYLRTGTNAFATSYGPMNNVIMNSTRHLSDADLHAMASYFKSLPPQQSASGAAAKPDVLQAGETLYNVDCGTCHQPNGLGADDAGPRLAGSLIVQAADPASLINIILYGPDVPDPRPAGHQWRAMESYGDDLSDEEVAALASYVRNAWNNKAGAVDAKQVELQR
jgi:mono/diheme cytochrome c family protein